jgi:hypothetical protein
MLTRIPLPHSLRRLAISLPILPWPCIPYPNLCITLLRAIVFFLSRLIVCIYVYATRLIPLSMPACPVFFVVVWEHYLMNALEFW